MAKRARKQNTLDPALPIYQIKVGLQHISPLIWRRLQTDDRTLDELHEILQLAMGWDDMHMHAFVIDGEQYGNPALGGDVDYDSRSVRLSDVLKSGHTRFRYDYDFGDDWRHIIDIEKTLPAEEGVRYPRCVAGERACPPEDSGGPYGYPDSLDRIQDPEHQEYEEILEWVGEKFDPEKFDQEQVNKELHYLRRWLGRRRGKNVPQAAFAKGSLVRVKPGIVHELYSDIPLGGWVGEIRRIGWLTPLGYAVHWTKPTLEKAPPVYFKRCQRDDLKPYRHWLEEDELEAADEETPTAMEQPTNLVTRPLSMEEPDDRIRMIFGLTRDDALPKADEPAQRHFLEYLKAHLSFPFKADYSPTWGFGPRTSGKVTVLRFADPPLDRKAGIVCEARKGKRDVRVPLAGLLVSENDPNFLHVMDYVCWRGEVQDDEEEDEPEESSQFPIGTIAYYGPDDEITTKVVAGVIKAKGAKPILKRWVATDVTINAKVGEEIVRFLKKHRVKRVATSEGNVGCPHEEGKDFPMGGDCPFCPWWKGKQGSGAKE